MHGVKTTFFLFGDFNDTCSNWESDHCTGELGTRLLNLIAEYNLIQVIKTPTRENHILDMLITNRHDYISSLNVIEPINDLDHSMITGCSKYIM